ncbi:sel1 repeat family protein, partial [Acinetobacter baumannii]
MCALSGLAYLYDAGLGVERDGARAVSLYQQALDGGMALAGYNLGGLYESGRSVPADPRRALALYEKAAAQGIVYAQTRI